MTFPNSFLTSLAEFQVIGDFLPFSTGSILEVENYVSQLTFKLQEDPYLQVSNQNIFSSFEVKVSKADKSDTWITRNGPNVTENTTSLALYFCILAPYWFYGACNWSTNWLGFVGGSNIGGSSCFLEPESLARVNDSLWNVEIKLIKKVTQAFRYTLLSAETLSQPAPVDLPFETLLGEKPYRIFDCFFYWAD